jgi:predicted dehydrogenase
MRSWATTLEAATGKRPRLEPDIRRLMEDKNIDALIIASCNHWHTPGAILACQAGKHVYVEKPVSHNISEGRKLVEASRKYQRVISGGTQNRSKHRLQKAIRLVHDGVIGDIYMTRWLISGTRASIGFQQPERPPAYLHWDLWLGPAPEQPFHRNLVHYNWHWFWDFGNGEMGNNGTHFMDVARWALGEGLPVKVHAGGGRFGYKDQAQTPNTLTASFEFASGKILTCDIRGVHTGEPSGWWFYGSDGSMFVPDSGDFKVYWLTNKSPDPFRSFTKEMDEGVDPMQTGAIGHLANFYDAVRANDPKLLRASIEEIHRSTVLCHLANISYRVGRKLQFNPESEKFVGDAEADQLVTRQYRKPFIVPEKI